MPTAFQHSLPVRFQRHPRRPPLLRSRPRACSQPHEPQPSQRPKTSLNPASPEPPAIRPSRNDKSGFLYKPEAVLGILAIGFLSSFAYIATAGRLVAAKVSERARRIAQDSTNTRRYKARLREKEFLESAVSATVATLSNTEDYLKKQIKRAHIAEERLQELAVSSADINAAMRRTSDLKLELQENEAELEKRQVKTKRNTSLLDNIKADIFKRRKDLVRFEEEVEEAQKELSNAQRKASESLTLALTEKEHLEAVLEQKQVQLAEEVAARDSYMNRISNQGDLLEKTELIVDHTLLDIEARRKKIDAVSKEAESIGKLASQEKLALETTIVREVQPFDIEDTLSQIRQKQLVLKNQIQASLKSETRQTTLCDNLRRQIEEREQVLKEQRAKLDAFDRKCKQFDASKKYGDEPSKEGRLGTAVEKSDIASHSDERKPHNHFISRVIESTVQSTSIRDGARKAQATSTASSSGATRSVADVPIKRRRGRPRKTDSTPLEDTPLAKPKRGRGRPRKVVSDVEGKGETSPKKKRGRPRKIPVSTSEEAALTMSGRKGNTS